ncbi:SDR family NAD(P)-dependent oxidoreductase [Mycolicibacterium arenosum]|uniref:SDR family oxidoreductase n=1 Tax=Mycolicibacterium arenosum TaxID=2952157 RepID=A0ABT1M3M3_9MYCO|nr:SDR family oxidoreductase [Mycolicibacterium sp. CAU 1645]MCP9273754.1 SDR family oxidoreductase [Mycolicibacterium sp. CAU 1645]
MQAGTPSVASLAPTLDLSGRIVVVSGAGGGGIGTTVTAMAARAGATVIAVSRRRENLDEHVGPLAEQGLSVITVAADASTDAGIATVMDRVRSTVETSGARLYGLVNIAGGAAPATWMASTRVSRDDWRALFTANLETAFFMSQAVAAELVDRGSPGSIVSVSSISGMNTAPFHIAYGTAKAGVVAMTRTMAVELATSGIRVNAVAPGVTDTAASRDYVDPDPDRDRTAIAMGRRGQPEEQAGAILFLLSDLAAYVTGQTLLVDGGINLRWSHVGGDNTSLFLKDDTFRESIRSLQ